jgi:SepF-like predicted cell division protein (DUF552 family)
MSDAIAGANTIAYILFTVIGVMFFLYSKSVEKQMEAMKETMSLLRIDSKSDDQEVKAEISKVDNLRVTQITDLHTRVGQTEKCIAKCKERISNLEGLHDNHN